jgi:aminopeptidase-like protein
VRGEKVTLVERVKSGVDPGGDAVWATTKTPVDNVLVADGDQDNLTGPTRPDGVTVAKTLYFPRAWAYRSIRGAFIRIDTVDYEVIGDPRPYDGGMTPTQWNLKVQVKDIRG